jgi:hypothetical protein
MAWPWRSERGGVLRCQVRPRPFGCTAVARSLPTGRNHRISIGCGRGARAGPPIRPMSGSPGSSCGRPSGSCPVTVTSRGHGRHRQWSDCWSSRRESASSLPTMNVCPWLTRGRCPYAPDLCPLYNPGRPPTRASVRAGISGLGRVLHRRYSSVTRTQHMIEGLS